MTTTTRLTGRLALTAATLVMLLSSCAEGPDHRELAPELTELPERAVGAVSVGPGTLDSISKVDKTTVFIFGEGGDLLGKVAGQAIYASQSLLSRVSLTTATAQRVTTLTSDGVDHAELGYENIVQAGTVDPESGASAMWFNSGVVDGVYSNRLVSRFPGSGGTRTSITPGVTRLVGHCGARIYALSQDAYVGTAGTPTKNTLYEMTAQDGPRVLHAWDFPEGFLPVSRNAVCSPDGNFLLALYASEESRKDPSGGAGLNLVRINLRDGSKTQTPLGMAGISEDVRRGTMYLSDSRLYWVTGEGTVVSVESISDTPSVTVDWSLQNKEIGSVTSTESGEVAVLSKETSWGIDRFDIASGAVSGDRVGLPWLDAVLGSTTESGRNTYVATDLAVSRR